MNDPFIKTENLTFIYDSHDGQKINVTALYNVNLKINKGEIVAILGKNGCGKSTLAKHFNAMLLPSGGRVFISGIDTLDSDKIFEGDPLISKFNNKTQNKESPKNKRKNHLIKYEIRKRVGLVLQNPENQIVSSIVEEDIAFGPENLGVDPLEIRERVDWALKEVGMYDHRHEAPYNLSGGQKQRIAIAGVLAMKPDCIVFDEPTSMLDPLGRKEVINAIKNLNKKNKITIVLVTHDMEEAVLADRVIVMDNGQILKDCSPEKVFADLDFLRKYNLEAPQSTKLINELKYSGYSFPNVGLTDKECVDAIENLLVKSGCKRQEYIDPYKKNITIRSNDQTQIKLDNINSDPIIEFKDVSFFYGRGTQFEKRALDNISLKVNRGEIIGIIGHTGSGKSTFIQHLNGLLYQDKGEILIDGQSISSKVKNKFKVGIVFQYPEHQLFEETVYKDIAFGPSNMGLSNQEVDQRIFMASLFTQLDKNLLYKSPFELSGGEQRRAAIAGVIAMDPDILVLDEPTAGLDPLGRESLLENIRQYHMKRKNTIILVSHSMECIAKFADRVMIMNKGKIEMFDTKEKIFSRVNQLNEIGLNIPQITSVMLKLKEKGYNFSNPVLTVEQAVCEIKNMIKNGGLT